MRKMASPRTQDLHCPQESCTILDQIPTNDLQISMDPTEQQYWGVWWWKLCWMPLHEKIHSGRCCDVEWPIRESAWSKTVGVLALSSGESELAAVVRAVTEGMGLHSILNDFCLCGHVAIKSDATAAIWMVHRPGLGKLRHLVVGDLRVQHHVRSGKFEFPKCQVWRIRAMHKPSILGRNHCCATRKLAIGSLSLMMASRDECRWVALCRGVDFNLFRTPRCMDTSGQEDCDEWTKLVKRVVVNKRNSKFVCMDQIGQEGRDEWTKLKTCPEDLDAWTWDSKKNRNLQHSDDV